jgi:hypothetical protein
MFVLSTTKILAEGYSALLFFETVQATLRTVAYNAGYMYQTCTQAL